MASARIGVDIGGTFTDLVLLDDNGDIAFTKVSSTPAAPEEAVLTGVERILEQARLRTSDVVEVLHGTTVGSNTLLQKVGAKCGLATWMKTALPRPATRGLVLWSISMIMS